MDFAGFSVISNGQQFTAPIEQEGEIHVAHHGDCFATAMLRSCSISRRLLSRASGSRDNSFLRKSGPSMPRLMLTSNLMRNCSMHSGICAKANESHFSSEASVISACSGANSGSSHGM